MTDDFERIPVVDVAALVDGAGPVSDEERRTAASLTEAAAGIGFVNVTGHGIAPSTVDG